MANDLFEVQVYNLVARLALFVVTFEDIQWKASTGAGVCSASAALAHLGGHSLRKIKALSLSNLSTVFTQQG